MAHSAGSLRCAHRPVAQVERTLTSGGESDANDPDRTRLQLAVTSAPILLGLLIMKSTRVGGRTLMHAGKGTWQFSASLIGVAFIGISVIDCTAAGMPQTTRVEFDTAYAHSDPIKLEGQLRRPRGTGTFPAVVLLHGCGGGWRGVDARWGTRLQSWGYVTLAVDSFGPRGITNLCSSGVGKRGSLLLDGYAALHFLAQQTYVDASRIVLMGISMGGAFALATVEQGWVERLSDIKFRAAVALYPPCAGASGITTGPTLVLVGESDDWTPASACRNMAMGRSEIGISRSDNGDRSKLRLVVYPNAYHGFDSVDHAGGRSYLGHWLEYNAAATTAAVDEVRAFLNGALRDIDRN
jgi:dienelactone hydrolase